MKKDKNTEKLIKDVYTNKMQVTTSSGLDKRILANSMSTLDKAKSEKSADTQPNILIIIAKCRITQLAAAAVIIIAISVFLMRPQQTKEIKTQQITQTVKSPAELTTVGSLIFAYRRGGMERLEQICDKAIAMAGPQPAGISMQEFLEEINNGS